MPLSRLLLRGREGWLAGGRSGVQPSGAPPEVPAPRGSEGPPSPRVLARPEPAQTSP